jgi:hypothetical protein
LASGEDSEARSSLQGSTSSEPSFDGWTPIELSSAATARILCRRLGWLDLIGKKDGREILYLAHRMSTAIPNAHWILGRVLYKGRAKQVLVGKKVYFKIT